MNPLTKYLTTGLTSLYLALAPASADATSGYEHKFKNYKPQIRAEEPISNILPDAIFVIPITPQRQPLPLELIMDLPVMDEVLVTPKPYKHSFLPTNLEKMPNKGKVK